MVNLHRHIRGRYRPAAGDADVVSHNLPEGTVVVFGYVGDDQLDWAALCAIIR